jgi:hypothetical protein
MKEVKRKYPVALVLSSCAGAAKTTAAVRVKNAVAKENFIMEEPEDD